MDTQDYDNLNDHDVEIISLDEVVEEQTQTVMPSKGRFVRSPLAPRFNRRTRILQSAALTIFTTILICALLLDYAPTRTTVLNATNALFSTPTEPANPGIDSFYLDSSPGWGQLFVDGKRINPLPTYGTNNALILTNGTHHLIWHAPPFADQHCTISIPPDLAYDTCQYNQSIGNTQGHSSWLISFSISLAQLPPVQRVALTQAMQTALDAQQVTTIVQPGESYAVSLSYAESMYSNAQPDIKATQPLHATLHFQLDTNINSHAHCLDDIFEEQAQNGCWFDGQNCLLLCSFSAYVQHLSYPAAEWVTYGMVHSLWNYSTLNGQPVATDQPDIDAQGATQDAHRLPFSISWSNNRWRVTTAFNNKNLLPTGPSPFCYPAQDEFYQYNMLHLLTSNIQGLLAFTLNYQPTLNPADGCIVTLNLGQDTSPGIPEFPVPSAAKYLERFGVFVALNAPAHKLWSPMPLADTYERQLAQQATIAANQQSDLAVKYSGNVVK